MRAVVFDAIREQVQSPDYSKGMDAGLKDHRDRLKRTEERIKGLVGFIADGDRSEYVVSTLRDLEAQAKAERAAIDRLHKEAQEPLRLPSIDEITAAGFRLDALLSGDPEQGRTRLRRWLRDSEIRIARRAGGGFETRGGIAPLAMTETEKPKPEQGLGLPRVTFVAGARRPSFLGPAT